MATDTERLDALGCSDTHCELRPAGRGGMGTNGGCKCLRGIADPNERARVREALRISAMTDPTAHNSPSERDESWPPPRPLPLDADTMREVLDGAARALIDDLGIAAAPDVVAAQLDAHVCNLVLRLRRVEASREAAERALRNLIACVRREHNARIAWLATLPDGACSNPPPQVLLDAEHATREALREVL